MIPGRTRRSEEARKEWIAKCQRVINNWRNDNEKVINRTDRNRPEHRISTGSTEG